MSRWCQGFCWSVMAIVGANSAAADESIDGTRNKSKVKKKFNGQQDGGVNNS